MNQDTLDRFEKVLEDGLVKVCSSAGILKETMTSPDMDARWNIFIKDYVADAVENYNSYPDAAIGFAAYLGMAVAHQWDSCWTLHRDDPYKHYYGPRGFDDMDDHIVQEILHLDATAAAKVSSVLSSCVAATQGLIRHEGYEAQTAESFYVLVRCYTVFFRLGVSLELYRLGYKKQMI